MPFGASAQAVRARSQGDLFVYLDAGGGSTTLHDPYGDGTTVYLPGNLPPVDVSGWPEFELSRYEQIYGALTGVSMTADVLIQVEDDTSATLLRLDGERR